MRRPPSINSPPWSNAAIPMPERCPLPLNTARSLVLKFNWNKWLMAAPIANANCVPEPNPACSGKLCLRSSLRAECSSNLAINDWAMAKARALAADSADQVSAKLNVRVCMGADKLNPMPPYWRPKPPCKSKKPMCKRARLVTLTCLAWVNCIGINRCFLSAVLSSVC